MAGMSDWLENNWIDHLFRSATFAKPTQLWIGLFTADPIDTGLGAEVSGGSYARVQRDPSDTNWTATQGGTVGVSNGTSGHTDNAAPVTFPAPTANWGTVTHFGVLTAATGGNLVGRGTLVTPRTIEAGNPAPSFATGDIDITAA